MDAKRHGNGTHQPQHGFVAHDPRVIGGRPVGEPAVGPIRYESIDGRERLASTI